MAPSSHAVGIDLGGTKILGRVLEPGDPREALHEVRFDTPRGADKILDALEEVIGRLDGLLKGAAPQAAIGTIGVGAAGLVDHRGVLRVGPNLPGVTDLDIADELAARVGLPVVVDNDANCAAWAEYTLGAARGFSDVVLVTLGTGIGAGHILGGVLQRGASGFAGEPGHMIVDPDGPPCPCGRKGCWERYASGSGLGRLARDAALAERAMRVVELAGGDPENVRGEHVTDAAIEGDPDALAVLGQFAWWVALGAANIVNILDPDVIVIGGGLANAGDLLFGPTREAFAGLVLAHDHRPPVPIRAAALGPDAGAVGAGLLAQNLLS